jgi:hypothetical protein
LFISSNCSCPSYCLCHRAFGADDGVPTPLHPETHPPRAVDGLVCRHLLDLRLPNGADPGDGLRPDQLQARLGPAAPDRLHPPHTARCRGAHGLPVTYVEAFGSVQHCGAGRGLTGGVISDLWRQYGHEDGNGAGRRHRQLVHRHFNADDPTFWAFISSIIVSVFGPSGGGHWAVQGPFIVPAAVALRMNQAAAAQAVDYGEAVGNMIQPFWALLLLAIAGIGARCVVGVRR